MSDGNYLNKVRKSESGNKDTAVNPIGGASGRYQFVKSTWEGLGYNWKDRFNPQLQEEAMSKYTAQTRKHFVDSFKSEPSDADLYGMHFLGSGTYIKALKSGDNTLITDVVSKKAYDYNKNVMSRNGKPITIGDLKQWLGSKMGNTTSTTSAAPLQPLEYQNFISDIDTELPQGAGMTFLEKEETKTAGEKAAALLNEENFLEDYAAIQAQQQEQQQSYQQQPMVAASEVIPIEYVAQTLPQEFQKGGQIPVSSNGVYDFPKQEVIVPTNNGRITMKNVNYPILGIDEFGNQQIMQPNGEYKFQGNTVHEKPILQEGGKFDVLDAKMAQTRAQLNANKNPQLVLKEKPKQVVRESTSNIIPKQETKVLAPIKSSTTKEKLPQITPNYVIPKAKTDLNSANLTLKEIGEQARLKEEALNKKMLGQVVNKNLVDFPKEPKKEELKGISLEELNNKESVKKIQTFLDSRGYNLNPNKNLKNEGIDGIIGNITMSAISDYNSNLGYKGYSSIKEGDGNLGKCKEKQCSEYVQNEIYRNIQPKVSQEKFRDAVGLKGDAWTIVSNIVKAGGKRVEGNGVAKGDIVGIYNPKSNYLQEAKAGAGYTHTGIIDKVNPDGSYYILHNVHKKIGTDKRGEPIYEGREFRSKVDPKSKGVEGFEYTVKEVARPAYTKVQQGQTKTVYKDITLNYDKTKLDPEQQQNVSKYTNSLNNYENKSKISQVHNLDEKEYQSLAAATMGIFGQETKYGTSWKAKPKEIIAGIREKLGGEEASRGAGRFKYKLNRPSDVTYLGITKSNFEDDDKVALNTMDKLARDYKTLLGKGHSKSVAMYRAISAYNSGLGTKEEYNKNFDVDYTNKVIAKAKTFSAGKDKEAYKTYLDELAEKSPKIAKKILDIKSE